jgi:alkanesulfonate monooxygenase SsuD/methylene tetrahydromethanopterin reductase-like flavin-dependent oxidoreductase (luciferase family)
MKFGVIWHTAYHGIDPDALVAFARSAEECGFESFYLPEHVVVQRGAVLGSTAVDPSLPFADPLQGLAVVASLTKRILLGTGVLQLPYHHPVTLAKRLATLDVLSRGRMRLLTVGLGAIPGEAEAVGVDFAARGRRADEAIAVLRLLWAGDENGVSFMASSSPSPTSAASPSRTTNGPSRSTSAGQPGRLRDALDAVGTDTSLRRDRRAGAGDPARADAGDRT